MTTFSQTGGIGIIPKRWTKILTVRRNRAAILAGSLLKFIDEIFTGAVLRIKLSRGRVARRSHGFCIVADFAVEIFSLQFLRQSRRAPE
jgi:hypothetical protein